MSDLLNDDWGKILKWENDRLRKLRRREKILNTIQYLLILTVIIIASGMVIDWW